MNLDTMDDGSLRICKGQHEGSEECDWERYVPEARVAEMEGMVPKWVPVSQRLPEVVRSEDGEVNAVIVFDPKVSDSLINIYSANTAWLTGPFSTATHWMPLPAAPKEEV